MKSKQCSINFNSEKGEKKAKGVVKCVIKNDINHANYRETLINSDRKRNTMSVIRSQKHEMYTMQINKISLSASDNERYLQDDGISSYAYGHYKILNE